MIEKIFKDWTLYEKLLLFGSIFVISVVTIIFKSDFLVMMTSIVGISAAFFIAKGMVLGQFLGILIVVLYSYVSFVNKYYGEVLIYVFIMLPLFIMGIVEWIRNTDKETKIVIPKKVSKKEWIIITLIAGGGGLISFYYLKAINTSLLVLSVLSIVGNLYGTYLTARRSKLGFIFYIFDDIILFIMWMIPVIGGNLLVLPMIFNPIVNFINDLYGIINWTKTEKKSLK